MELVLVRPTTNVLGFDFSKKTRTMVGAALLALLSFVCVGCPGVSFAMIGLISSVVGALNSMGVFGDGKFSKFLGIACMVGTMVGLAGSIMCPGGGIGGGYGASGNGIGYPTAQYAGSTVAGATGTVAPAAGASSMGAAQAGGVEGAGFQAGATQSGPAVAAGPQTVTQVAPGQGTHAMVNGQLVPANMSLASGGSGVGLSSGQTVSANYTVGAATTAAPAAATVSQTPRFVNGPVPTQMAQVPASTVVGQTFDRLPTSYTAYDASGAVAGTARVGTIGGAQTTIFTNTSGAITDVVKAVPAPQPNTYYRYPPR